MRVKVGILGHFGEGKNLLNGQTIKTRIITDALQKQLGQDQILKIDTHGGWINLLKAPFQTLHALKNGVNILIFPAHNGLRVYAPLLFFQRHFFRGRKLHYVVIGGWLPDFLLKHKLLEKILMNFDGIYVETRKMQTELEKRGFQNSYILPNCKELTILSPDALIYSQGAPYKLCTFSRVMKEKGIEDAVNAVLAVNKQLGRIVYTLDIYGPIAPNQIQWFAELENSFPEYIHYAGTVPFDKSVEVLKDYYALLFPTRFYTEGIPGTIIDAYAAGIPVISARWESYSDVVAEGITGIGYDFDNTDQFEKVLLEAAQNPKALLDMKENCISKAKDYIPKSAVQIMTEKIGRV